MLHFKYLHIMMIYLIFKKLNIEPIFIIFRFIYQSIIVIKETRIKQSY